MKKFPRQQGSLHPREGGAAIIIVLCFVVLIAGLTVTFLLRAASERQISNANSNGTKVELLGDTALDIVVDDLRQEIQSHSTVYGTGTNLVYVPTSATYAVPTRTGTGTIPNLLRRSDHGDTSTRAANSSSTSSSQNGRSVTLSRWNAHYLLPLAGANSPGDSTPASSFTAPDWIIVTRGGPAASAAWSSTLADSSPQNSSYAIGRYAYAIYDEGGLLDMNAAGYPSSATSTQYGAKGGVSYADLRQFSLTAAQINQIVGWRNYGTVQPSGSFPNFTFDTSAASRFSTLVASGTNSFLTSSTNTFNGNSDHAFINRQQLIKLFQKGISTSSSDQTKLQAALQYLGTFSREVNGPTWSPSVNSGIPSAYATSQYQTGSSIYNPFVLTARVAKVFTRADGSQAAVGEPLVKNRFPLEKLALLEKMQGYASLNDQDKDDIARYFGLDPVTDSTGYYRHWTYPTTNAKYLHTTGAILSLSDVATKNREPDFFELIEAGVLSNSLALRGRSDNTTDVSETSSVLQILRIGANIIDQWDADNFPTTITSSVGDVYGIEDLPYINKALFTFSGVASISSPTAAATYTGFMNFQLWNPHQSLSSDTGAYPTDLQLAPIYISGSTSTAAGTNSDTYSFGLVITAKNAAGTSTSPTWYWNESASAWSAGAWKQPFATLSGSMNSGGIISVSYTTPSTAFREPSPASSTSLQFCKTLSLPDSTSVQNSLTFSQAITSATAKYIYFNPKITYRLQYRENASSAWHTYGTFLGLDTSTSPTLYASFAGFTITPWLSLSNSAKSGWYAMPKGDPRTGRFGTGQNTTEYDLTSANYTLTPGPVSTYTSVYGRIESNTPFASTAVSSSNPYRLDLWAANSASGATNGTLATNPAYADKDGVVRPGDSYYGGTTTNPFYESITSSTATGIAAGQQARPIILNRPFRSVGELGYAYRDMPWKTLDLFSASSADAALLDLFSLNGSQPVLAGRLNPNTRQQAVLAAVLTGATQASGGTGTTLSSNNATAIASAIIALSKTAPFRNRSELVTRLMADPSLANVSTVKSERESVIRALADCANTRTWNLMIDLVAQVGRYPTTATSLDKFVVEGERHYWLHVAIDRYTGQIVDKQVEIVRE